MNAQKPSLKDRLVAEAVALSAYYDQLVSDGFTAQVAGELTMQRAERLRFD